MRQTKFGRLARLFRKSDDGNIAMMTSVVMVVIVSVVALALDTSKGFNTKARLADVADAVSLALAKSGHTSQADLTREAMAFINQTYPGEAGANISIESIVKDGNAVTVKIVDKSKNTFTGNNRGDALKVAVSSTSVWSQNALDVALVLDSTGSMRGSKLKSLKVAAKDMIDTVENIDRGNARFSMVPFSDYVNIGTDLRKEIWLKVRKDNKNSKWEGCVGSRSNPHHLSPAHDSRKIPALYSNQISCGKAALQPLTRDFKAVKSAINSLSAKGWTYMPAGLIWGWRSLDAGAPLEHSVEPNTIKVLVLMTDGENTKSKNGKFHNKSGANHLADKATGDLCTAIKADDIMIYTIAYAVNDLTTRRLLEDCASARSNYFDAKNASDLSDAFKDIARSLNELRITA